LDTSLQFKLNTFSSKTYSLLSGQDSEAIQACNCKVIWFKSVSWHDGGSSEHKLRYAPASVYTEDPSSCRLTCIYTCNTCFVMHWSMLFIQEYLVNILIQY